MYLKFILLSLVVFPSIVSAQQCAGYSDVLSNNQYCDDIKFATASRWVNGYKNGSFKPDKKITREEFTKIVIQSTKGLPKEYRGGKNCFLGESGYEIKKEMWSSGYICYAKDKEIIKGYPDGTFKPLNNVSYAEALKITLRAFGFDANESAYPNWYDPYAQEALYLGVVVPTGAIGIGTNYNYSYEITRGYMAYLIHTVYENHTRRSLFKPNLWTLHCDAKNFAFDPSFPNPSCKQKWAIQILYETQIRSYNARAIIIRNKMDGVTDAHDALKSMVDSASAVISLMPTDRAAAAAIAPNLGAVISGAAMNGDNASTIVASNAIKTAFSIIGTSITAAIDPSSVASPFTYLQLGLDGVGIINDLYGGISLRGATKELTNVNIAISYLTDYYSLGMDNTALLRKYADLYGDPSTYNIYDTIYHYAIKKGHNNTFFKTDFDLSKIVDAIEQTKVMNKTLVKICYEDGKCHGQKAKPSYRKKPEELMIKIN